MEIKLEENERVDDLQINNLKIIQKNDGFCFGIDSVLLSHFAEDIKSGSKVLDLGTGTGIISILLTALVEPEHITGVEIQPKVADMARRSVSLNNLDDKISIINEDIRKLEYILKLGKYDVIITNPPYIKANSGVQSASYTQLISRHEIECNLEDIARISNKLLREYGQIYMVHRPDRLADIIETFRRYKLEVKEIKLVYSRQCGQANLVLIKAIKNGKPFLKIRNPIYIYNKNGEYTEDIFEIYGKNK